MFEVIQIKDKQIDFRHNGVVYSGKLWASSDTQKKFGHYHFYSGIVEITHDGYKCTEPKFTWEEHQQIGKLCRKFNPEEAELNEKLNAQK